MITIDGWFVPFKKAKALALNKLEQEATDIFKTYGFNTRILYRDSERFHLIENWVPRRVAFGIKNGRVVEVVQG